MNHYFRFRHFVARNLRRFNLMPLVRWLRPESATINRFDNSHQYWKERYEQGGDSGEGSYGALARYKARYLDTLIRDQNIHSVIEFGCGDGHQASMLTIDTYTGIDISDLCIEKCRATLSRKGWRFMLLEEYNQLDGHPAHDLAISLDVVYHLVEDATYYAYLNTLFRSSDRFVLIYSSNFSRYDEDVPHVRHREFVADVAKRFPTWAMIATEQNPYAKDPRSMNYGSFAQFFLFQRQTTPA